jgi:hypothetical protein
LHQKPAFTNRVVGFANWDVHPYILNTERSGIPVWTGFESNFPAPPGSRLELAQQLQRETTPYWPDMTFDSFFCRVADEYVRLKGPRIVWIAFSETDEWAHEGRYDMYLWAAHNMDNYLRTFWTTTQSLPQYRGKTTFILTCDLAELEPDGGPRAKVDGAENIWLAVLGPDSSPMGERTNNAAIGQNQMPQPCCAARRRLSRGGSQIRITDCRFIAGKTVAR